ncbi:MAG: STAS domain-containing protein, partial [Mycobacterium sp.]
MTTSTELEAHRRGCACAAEDGAARLQTDTDRRGSAVILHARGEVDAYTLGTWRRIVQEISECAGAGEQVIVDITGLDFIASAALAALANEADV